MCLCRCRVRVFASLRETKRLTVLRQRREGEAVEGAWIGVSAFDEGRGRVGGRGGGRAQVSAKKRSL